MAYHALTESTLVGYLRNRPALAERLPRGTALSVREVGDGNLNLVFIVSDPTEPAGMRSVASGKFVLRLPPSVHRALRAEASRRGISLNGLCQQVLETHTAGGGWPSVGREDDAGLIARIRDFLGDSLMGIVLFGSVARGAAREKSDVDLLIILDVNQEVTRRLYSLWDDRFPEDALSPHFVRLPARAEDAGTVWLEASVDGVILHDRDGKVSRFLADIRRMIAEGQLSRRSAYGMPYWVRAEEEESRVQ